MKVYEKLARLIDAHERCKKENNSFSSVHMGEINNIMENSPSGSGIDNGTILDIDNSDIDFMNHKLQKIVFFCEYHHMKDGYYDGWTNHIITIKPSFLSGFDIHISGSNRNAIKEYLYDVYESWLNEDI